MFRSFLMAICLPGMVWAQGALDVEISPALQEARTSWLNGRYDGIWDVVRSEAESGSPVAMNILAASLTETDSGQGLDYDPATAVMWYEKAAAQGFTRATYNLALFYLEEHGDLAPDYDKARALAEQAIEDGYVHANNLIGDMYFDGKGVEEDLAESTRWYRIAAEQGSFEGLRKVGYAYYHGNGVPENVHLAQVYLNLAVAAGDRRAIPDLAWLAEGNDGMEQDLVKAYLLYKLGVERGWPRAAYEMSGFIAYEDYEGFWSNQIHAYGYCLLAMDWGYELEDEDEPTVRETCAERADGLSDQDKAAARVFADAQK